MAKILIIDDDIQILDVQVSRYRGSNKPFFPRSAPRLT